MELVQNPHADVGKRLLARLRERDFKGYVRTCIDELLAGIDAGSYSCNELGTSESEVLDLAIGHVGKELLSGHHYPFAYLKLHNDLVCRKSRIKATQEVQHSYPVTSVPFSVPANDRKAA